ncbi:MAG: ATP-binding protein [Clostridia bacterium]|nr:ATP-binding protein [Clostridia bacterium]
MENYEKYIEDVIENIKLLLNSEKDKTEETVLNFIKNDEKITKEIQKNKEFCAFEYLRTIFNFDNYSWICFLISVLNELESKNIDPIDKVSEIFFKDKSKSEFFNLSQNLSLNAFSLFLDKNKKIDKNIFDFVMSNGKADVSSREFSVYFPSKEKIIREKEAMNLYKVCKVSMQNIYFVINGEKGIGKKTLVKRTASILAKALIIVDIDKCLNSESNFSDIITTVLRQVRLMNGMVCFDGIELIKNRKRRLEFILKMAKNYSKNSFFISNEKIDLQLENFDQNIVWIKYPIKNLNNEQILKIWQSKIKNKNLEIEKLINLNEIAGTFRLTPGQINLASNLIFSEKILNGKITKKIIFNSIQKTVQANFGENAHLIKTENTWDDLIIPEQDKQMIIDICKQQKIKNIVFEKWKLEKRINYGRGLSFLFSGPPGTGKTMAAGIIANEMGLELYRADLSRIVSKYIGETEKNLSNLFDEAEKSNSILLFDETDALFSQRTSVKDAKDRGANLEISYLLQRMENHSGICIMTTNYIENIDKAFFRRISYVFHFPKPNKKDRKKIWENIFGANVPLDKNIDFDFISNFELSGGSIKNIVISACLKAAQTKSKVDMSHILKSVEYELKKQGYTPLKSDFAEYSYLL